MKKAEKLHLLEKVIFLGERQDVHRLMQGMDVFLFPSLFEGFGIVVLEAQTAGVPCVVSDRVPDSCIITENVMAMDLKCSCGLWANRVIGIKYSGNREKAYQNAVAEGFDIQDNIKRLEMFYQAFGTGA